MLKDIFGRADLKLVACLLLAPFPAWAFYQGIATGVVYLPRRRSQDDFYTLQADPVPYFIGMGLYAFLAISFLVAAFKWAREVRSGQD